MVFILHALNFHILNNKGVQAETLQGFFIWQILLRIAKFKPANIIRARMHAWMTFAL